MGASDVVPGISGGTIAFITGIYNRLMSAISNISSLNYNKLLKGKVKEFVKPLDLGFLIPLVFGIFVSILLLSKVILHFMTVNPSGVFSFFIGLILISSFVIFSKVDKKKNNSYLFMFIGLLFGFILSILPTSNNVLNPPIYMILLGGFVAITAMLLPGVSGSFLLLSLGIYKATLNALHNFDLVYIGIFGLGALLSLIFVSKFIKKLLDEKKNQTLSVLFGLVIGALSVPFKQLALGFESLLYLSLGMLVSYLMTKLGKR